MASKVQKITNYYLQSCVMKGLILTYWNEQEGRKGKYFFGFITFIFLTFKKTLATYVLYEKMVHRAKAGK